MVHVAVSLRQWWRRRRVQPLVDDRDQVGALDERGERRPVLVGVPVVLREFEGQIHGFINMTGVSRASRDALIEVAGVLRALVHVSQTAKEHSEPIRPGR